MDLLHHLLHTLRQNSSLPHLTGQPVIAAVSGGADSLCLLHLLHRLATELGTTLGVATLDHGLRGQAGAADADYVADLARSWNLPVWRGTLDVKTLAAQYGLGLEEAARRARYGFLAQAAREHGARTIATGHHADDQAETLLMHLVRGTGLAGLRGMQPVTPLSDRHLLPDSPPPGNLCIVRPLLGTTRQQIEAYCHEHGLTPREDATNDDPAYLRNRIRLEVLPMLEQLNPEIRTLLARTAGLLANDYTNIQALTASTLARLCRDDTPGRITLDLAGFRQVDPGLQRWILRRVVANLRGDTSDLGFSSLEAACNLAREGTTGQRAVLPGDLILQVSYYTLTVSSPDASPPAPPDWPLLPPGTRIAVNIDGITPLPGSKWRLVTRWLQPDEDAGAYKAHPYTATLVLTSQATLILRTRLPGDRFAPLGMAGKTQKIKELLINARIPAWQRDQLPILTAADVPAWLCIGPESRVAEPFAVRPDSSTVLLLYYTHD